MKKFPRLLLAAMIALALSLLSLFITVVGSSYMRSIYTSIDQEWGRIVSTAPTAPGFQDWIEGLPHPPGWVLYSVSAVERSASGSVQFRSVAHTESRIDTSPAFQVLEALRLVRRENSGYWTASVGTLQYQFEYSYGAPGRLFEVGILGWFLIFWLCLALWLYQDAKGRQVKQALPWLGLGLFGGPVAVAIWLIQRPSLPPPPPVCTACGTQQVEDATYCISCGSHLKPTCPECGRAIHPAWKHCPSCGNHLAEEPA
jgi:hypothetical protein